MFGGWAGFVGAVAGGMGGFVRRGVDEGGMAGMGCGMGIGIGEFCS